MRISTDGKLGDGTVPRFVAQNVANQLCEIRRASSTSRTQRQSQAFVREFVEW